MSLFGNENFYHNTIRKYITLFGVLFNDIVLERKNSENEVEQTIKIPIIYGPRHKIMSRIEQDPKLDKKVAITLPRMSFEMTGLSYDADRKRSQIHQNKNFDTKNGRKIVSVQFVPQPYNFTFTLHIFVRNYSDGVNIVENILPFFAPEWTTSVKLIPEMDITLDIPTILQGINLEDSYEGDLETRRAVIWSLDFQMKGYIFGPVKRSGVIIRRTTTHLFDTTDNVGGKIKEIERLANTINVPYANTVLSSLNVDASKLLSNTENTGNTSIVSTITTFPTLANTNIIDIDPDEDIFKLDSDIHEYI